MEGGREGGRKGRGRGPGVRRDDMLGSANRSRQRVSGAYLCYSSREPAPWQCCSIFAAPHPRPLAPRLLLLSETCLACEIVGMSSLGQRWRPFGRKASFCMLSSKLTSFIFLNLSFQPSLRGGSTVTSPPPVRVRVNTCEPFSAHSATFRIYTPD